MKVLIETSTLVSGAICWEYKIRDVTQFLVHRFYEKCNALFEIFKKRGEQKNVIITKTVETEARNALKAAVISTIKERNVRSLRGRYKEMVLQHLVLNDSLDRLDYYVEECSIRLPINTAKRDNIRDTEIEPFMRELVKITIRYIQPRRVPGIIRDWDLRDELKEIMLDSLPEKGIIYKGMPGKRDLTIMAEAALLFNEGLEDKQFYVASCDNHFKPNPIQIGSYLGRPRFTGELDTAVRDALSKKFGFICEDPQRIIQIIEEEQE